MDKDQTILDRKKLSSTIFQNIQLLAEDRNLSIEEVYQNANIFDYQNKTLSSYEGLKNIAEVLDADVSNLTGIKLDTKSLNILKLYRDIREQEARSQIKSCMYALLNRRQVV